MSKCKLRVRYNIDRITNTRYIVINTSTLGQLHATQLFHVIKATRAVKSKRLLFGSDNIMLFSSSLIF